MKRTLTNFNSSRYTYIPGGVVYYLSMRKSILWGLITWLGYERVDVSNTMIDVMTQTWRFNIGREVNKYGC